MKEALDYIKETGEEIKSLNLVINERDKEIKKLLRENSELKEELAEKESEFKSLKDLANTWYGEYSSLKSECRYLENKCDAFIEAFIFIAPKLAEDINNDLDDGIFSDLLHHLERNRW